MWLVLVFVAGCFLGSLELCLVHRWNHLFSFFWVDLSAIAVAATYHGEN